jgi:superkiller protein 8
MVRLPSIQDRNSSIFADPSRPQSKQYLTLHTVDQGANALAPSLHDASALLTQLLTAHPTEIFSLAPTPISLFSASGSSSIRIHSTVEPTFPLQQELTGAHKLGCHHVATARDGAGNVAASVGFSGEIKIWRRQGDNGGTWELWWEVAPTKTSGGDVWAVALSADENYMACTTSDGRIHVWDLNARERVQTYETGSSTGGGSFALSVDLSRDGKLTASGHESGAVYVFNNDAGRMAYSLSGMSCSHFPLESRPRVVEQWLTT